ncbi:RCC1-like G exchanging factor-like protein [Frankliniella occidentalis]|uniref:RCC1-like G exchanging factor-like protein n=1 Tax=Frankliniella occidentalis TaxID=133901 RepID=A0A6J1T4C0_FRAOC|nr:RCC1-like G exchanging factor-like protein [Frankliniella occidentalis]
MAHCSLLLKCRNEDLLRCSFICHRFFSTQRVLNKKKGNDSVPVFDYGAPSEKTRRVYAWGVAETGALGNYTSKLKQKMKKLAEFYHHPIRLNFSLLYQVYDITCGYGFTAFTVEPNLLKGPHKVFGCGVNTDSQIGYHAPRKGHPLAMLMNPGPIEIPFKNFKTKVIGLAAGRAHLLVLTDEEGVFTLGNNAYGQCGRPVIADENYVGSRNIHCIPDVSGSRIRSVACGQDHSMFITQNGDVYACGWNADGQTAQNNFESHFELRRVTGDIEGEDIVKVSSAGDCVLALNRKGEVFGWGNSEYGQLERHTLQLSTSKHLKSTTHLGKIVDVAAGGSFCMVLNEHGQVFVWGYGILGKGPKAQKSDEPTEIPSVLFGKNKFQPDVKVTSIACGVHHLAALTNSGDLYTWGHNRGGCLGQGHEKDQFFPLKVAIGAVTLKVCCGVDHMVALCKPF